MEAIDEGGTTTYALASFGTRFLAYMIDTFILFVINFVLNSVLDIFLPLTFTQLVIFNLLVFAAYHWYCLARRAGQTPGKRAMRIRVVKTDGTAISETDAALRVFGYIVGQMALYLGYFWPLFDSHSQAWHDKMANTYVIQTGEAPRTIQL
jgi:uncharacterized RDD family membrane protein YckC